MTYKNLKSDFSVLRYSSTAGKLLILLAVSSMIFISSCSPQKKMQLQGPQIPYPDQKLATIIQAQVDSSQSLWFLDAKSTVSFYCNDQIVHDIKGGVSTQDVTVISEGIFHALAEVKLPKKILLLTLERPFKERGTHSIWQVVKLEEKD
jgi:hypothetical protein